MADRTAYSIVSCTAVFPSIGLVDACNFLRSSCVKHLALTAILKHSGPSDARDWFPDAPQYRFRSDLSLTEWSPLRLLKSVGETKSKKRKNHVKE